MFKKVDPQQNFPKLEQEILNFWQENDIFAKTLKKESPKGKFVFYEGPPTANGRPGIHHVIGRSFKDLIPRFKTMQGYQVSRRAGWDTHGLPVEIEAEKQLGISGKKQIEDYGIAKFNEKCRESVWTYKAEWEKLTERIGFWVDLKNPYITYENQYIEKVWGVLKQIWDKGLIYSGFKVVPYCPRCGTTLSSHEVAQGYKTVEDQSIFVKFPIVGQKDTYFLVWTTTPWTLPANIALAVNDKFKYVEVKLGEEKLILAESRVKVLKGEYEIVRQIDGQDLVSMEYEPLFEISEILESKKEIDYRVWSAPFVSDVDGTGIVHIAPSFGADDKSLQDDYGFSAPLTVAPDGTMLTKIGKGKFVKDADADIKADLTQRGLLYKEDKIKHEYPFCWRCDSILIYYAKQTWFIEMSKLRNQLLKSNETINWVPGYIKNGRFGEWLKDIKDWALSRERYWGTPLPIWQCECGQKIMIGSINELKEKAANKVSDDLDLHKPFVDEVEIKCQKCGKNAKRVSEVIDVWFDSGAMPFASGEFPENYPADYICEGIDQTRGWFYTLLAIATCLEEDAPYKNVICFAHVLDEQGKKMSKSKGNVINPWDVIDKFGADSTRWYFYTVNDPGMPKRMSERNVEQTLRQFILTLWNVYSFFVTYANIDGFMPSNKSQNLELKSEHILDKWVLSQFNKLVKDVTESLENYNITTAGRSISEFTVELSTWYLRRSRKRRDTDFYATLFHVLINLAKLIAPFVPFTAEAIYQNLKTDGAESVHLGEWPQAGEIDEQLLQQMAQIKALVEKAHGLRGEVKIRVRQPLAKATINKKFDGELLEILADEINVKKVEIDEKQKDELILDTNLTEELKKEGLLRDLIRSIQDTRKKAGLNPGDMVILSYSTDDDLLNTVFNDFSKQIKLETNLSEIENKKIETDYSITISLNDNDLFLGVKK